MPAQSLRLLFLNVGHFADHLFMLIFAKAAFSAGLAFGLAADGAYAEMIPYGIPSLVLFGAGAPLAAHLADKWHRNGMIAVFFIGIGLAAIATSFAETPMQIAFGLAAIGLFAAIYHPVGIAMLVQGGGNIGWRLGSNGVWGNMGVAAAPLITGFILAGYDWRLAFVLPGIVAVLIGLGFVGFMRSGRARPPEATAVEKALVGFAPGWQRALLSLALVTAGGGFVFGAMTFIIPRMFEVSMPGVSTDVAVTGILAALVYAIAAFAQLVVGRTIDRRPIKPVLLTVALGQPVLIGLMALQTDLALFAVAVLAMGFVFGQIPISDAVLARYVPDQWRAKVLSIKFMLNLVIGAGALLTARFILAAGEGFDMVMAVLAMAACLIFLAALLLPAKSGAELVAAPAAAGD
ncbi:MAG: MFS transporter [Alphaproteobacteria bacterium]|nr:MFS transporter [Alphaproteobacteria bacterium]MDP6567458.1 MFS transporter [Alphaproteobacteria bacterium]MDP6816036.1 MFS transporter [Alphaproteobacteria bacterium]